MDKATRICLLCRCSSQQLSSRAAQAAKPRAQWARTLASSTTIATSSSRPSGRLTEPTSPWQGARHAPMRNSQLISRSRHFSTSRRRQAAIINPRQDEEGQDMVVEITPRAADRLKQIMAKDANPDLALRITVESGGCHGFQYLMSLTDMSKVSEEEDTVFEAYDGARVVLDEPSLELLKGSKVDYTMELIGSQFKIVDNPLATSSCGCGTSFDIKA